MPDVTIQNISSEAVFIRDFYVTLQPGKSAAFFRSASDLMRSAGMQELAAAGKITFTVTYTDVEKSTRFDNFPGVGILTSEGGVGVRMINRTGAPSVKGTLVEASTTDDGFDVADASANDVTGVVFEGGVADGEECLVVVGGTARVLLKDGTASTAHYWVRTADVAGRADATNAAPPGGTVTALEGHFAEIGHCLETQGAGTDVLALCVLHFN